MCAPLKKRTTQCHLCRGTGAAYKDQTMQFNVTLLMNTKTVLLSIIQRYYIVICGLKNVGNSGGQDIWLYREAYGVLIFLTGTE